MAEKKRVSVIGLGEPLKENVMKQVNLSRTEYSLLMLIRRVRLPPRAVAVLIADHFRRHKNYERLEIARIYQGSMESIEREERRNKNE